MPQNAELLLALQDDTIISRPAGAGAIDALDALMKAGPNAPGDDFRAAILAKKDFWHNFRGMNVDPPPANNAGFLDPAGGGPLGESFAELHKLVAQRRVQAGLKASGGTLDEAFLVDLINGDANNARAKLATKPAIFGALATLTKPAAWDATTEGFLNAGAIAAIKAQAKEQLLLNKINNTVASQAQIENLITQAAGGDLQFQAALQLAPWNLSLATAGNLAAADFTDNVKKAALSKGAQLYIQNEWDTADLLAPGLLGELNKDTAGFRTYLAGVYDDVLFDDDIAKTAKSQLGQRFLQAQLSHLGATRANDLATIAAQGNVADFVRVLKTQADLAGVLGPNNYVDHAVTAQSLPILRQAAALQALKHKIAECDDPAALDALVDATTKEKVQGVLAKQKALGFTTDPGFREALKNIRNTDEIIAAAHVQRRLLAGKPDDLKALAKVDGAGTYANTKAFFEKDLGPPLLAKVTAHLTPERITEIRQRALLGYAKTQLIDPRVISNGNLDNLVQAGAHAAVTTGVGFLMDGGHEADDLVAGLPHDSGFSFQLRAFAAAEQVARGAAALVNLNAGDYDRLIGYVNDFSTTAGYQQPLIAVLPPKEKQALQERLVTNLVSRFPTAKAGHPITQLNALAVAKDEAAFRKALTDMGITAGPGQAWVNDASIKKVQQAASVKSLELQIDQTAQFGIKAHPELLAVVQQLPLKKQQDLLRNPATMNALLNAVDEETVKNILAEKKIKVGPLVQENKNLTLLNQIANPHIARILAQQNPPLVIDDSKIRDINKIIHVGGNVFDDATALGANYIKAINDIKGHIGVVPVGFYTDFGLNAGGTALPHGGDPDADGIRDDIKQQHAHNASMLAKATGVAPGHAEYNLITFCAALPKTGLFTTIPTGHYDQIKADIKAAKSIDEFMTTARGKAYAAVVDLDSMKLTPEVFKQLKREQNRQILLDTAQYDALGNLPAQKQAFKEMTDLFAKMKTHNDKIRDRLERFGNTKSIDWFNPAFHAAAKQNAEMLGNDFKEFAEGCDIFLTQLEHQKAAIQEQLDGLPLPSQVAALDDNIPLEKTQKLEIEAYRKKLDAKKLEVEKDYNYYKKMDKVLRGDPESEHPLLNQGLLKTVEQAKAGKQDIKFHFESSYEDVDASTMKDYFKKGWEGSGVGAKKGATAESQLPGGAKYYHAVPALEEGKIRVHKIAFGPPGGNDRLVGGFIEERGSLKETVAKDGTKEYSPTIRLTVNEFPKAIPAGHGGIPPATSEKALTEARVNYSMAFACQMLAGLHEPPSEKNPIVLDGWDEEELRHLWTAFVVMGAKNPDMQFDSSAIKVISPVFNPAKEESYIAGLASGSHYHKIYMKSDAVRTGISFMQEASEHRSGNKKEQGQMQQDLSKLSQMFKQNLNSVVAEVKGANVPLPKKTPTLGGS